MNKSEEEGHKDKKPKSDNSSMDVPESDHWKKDWIVETTHDGQTIYKPVQKSSGMDEVDFLPKKRRSVNRKKSSKQKRVKSPVEKKSKRSSVHEKKVRKSLKVSGGRKQSFRRATGLVHSHSKH
jgi:hypothetical protein